jgi:FtsP/CotA-like multicopper oxidase with cupredoxin domain
MNQGRNLFPSGRILTALLVVALAPIWAVAAVTTTAKASSNPVPPVPNPCPRFTAGSSVRNPPALFSEEGILNVRFSYQTTTDANSRALYCFMTPNGVENPTLYVNPGDHLVITITNNTPTGTMPMVLNPPNCGDSTMNTASVNIHYHGTNTSPVCGQDEVIKTIINPGQTFQYNLAFPNDEPPGLYWYHPHVHGIAEKAVLGGASGAIVVNGINNVQPAVSGLRQRILVVRDQPQIQGLGEGGGGCTNGVPFQDITVNNVPIDSNQAVPGGPVTFIPAVFRMSAGEKQFWRLTNSSSDTILDLQVQYDGVAQTIQLVAVDGVSVNSQDGTQPGAPIPVQHFRLPPASRVEFIVTGPSSSVKLAQLVTTSINTGSNGDCDPNRPIFTVKLGEGEGELLAKPAADDRVGTFSALSSGGRRFAGLAQAPIAQSRLVFFDEIQPTSFFMAVAGQPEKVFDPNAPPAIVATQGTVEEWTVENHALENHEFHFHQVHFLVESQNNFEVNGQVQELAINGQYLDMIEVPAWAGPPQPYPNVKLLIDFRGPDVGTFVFHCHILNHEDLGMMNIIQVVNGSANKGSPAKPEVVATGTAKHAVEVPAKPEASDSAPAAVSTGAATGGRKR